MALRTSPAEPLGTAGTLFGKTACDSFWCGSKNCQVPLKHDAKMIFIAPNMQDRLSLFDGTEETGHYSPFCQQFKGLHAKHHMFFSVFMFVYVFIFNICEC